MPRKYTGSIYGLRFEEEVGWNRHVGWLAMNTTEEKDPQGEPLIEVIANGSPVGRFRSRDIYYLASDATRIADSDI